MPPGPAKDDLQWNTNVEQADAEIAAGHAAAVLKSLDALQQQSAARRSAEQVRLEQTRGLAFFALKDWEKAAAAFERAIAVNQGRAASYKSFRDRMAELQLASSSYRDLTQIDLQQRHNPEKALRVWHSYLGDTWSAAEADAPESTAHLRRASRRYRGVVNARRTALHFVS